jgi:kynurenine 3-monooxygenase
MISPHVVISGAGPAGLLMAILLAQAGIFVTVMERTLVVDSWSNKSYSINLNSRGLSALDHAGVLEKVQAVSMARHRVVVESHDGGQQMIPRDPPHFALTRPALIECLESILVTQQQQDSKHITLQRGVGVTHVVVVKDNGNDVLLNVTLDNGSTITCTHLIGADGKFSTVRNSVEDWKNQFTVQSEPAFGVLITPHVSPERWRRDATTIFRPPNGAKYYILASPLPDDRFSVSVVCYEEIREDHPWCLPREEHTGLLESSWESEPTDDHDHKFAPRLAAMIQKDLPLFYKDINGFDSLSTARTMRRSSWLRSLVDEPLYCDSTGRVALIGDAAHAMTAAIGEGCNCALESAVSLKECLTSCLQGDSDKVTVEAMTKAILKYGRRRPSEVMPIQTLSAEGNRYKVPEATM